MKKIGLFLGTEPGAGGEFQYSLVLLDAVAALPPAEYAPVVLYTEEAWREHLQGYDLKKVFHARGFWNRALSNLLTMCNVPMTIWHRHGVCHDPMGRALLQEGCDLWIFPAQDKVSYQVPVPALVSVHDLMHRYERRFPEAGSCAQFIGREHKFRNISRWAQGILVDSECGRRQMIESYGTEQGHIHVLPYIAPRYLRQGNPRSDFTAHYRLPAKYLFYPAQFWKHKNHHNLIRAVASLKSEIPDLRVVFAGTRKNAYDSVQKLVGDLHLSDDVSFLGYVPDSDLPELYHRARALVMPTFFGPTNIPPLEAFTAGCPVAVSDIYGMPEEVGDAALLFNPGSVEEIADCIRKLWVDDLLCAELARRGQKRVAAWGSREFNRRFREIVEHIVSDSGHYDTGHR